VLLRSDSPVLSPEAPALQTSTLFYEWATSSEDWREAAPIELTLGDSVATPSAPSRPSPLIP
jgi:hypothetical protein